MRPLICALLMTGCAGSPQHVTRVKAYEACSALAAASAAQKLAAGETDLQIAAEVLPALVGCILSAHASGATTPATGSGSGSAS